MSALQSGVHKVFDTSQFRTIRKSIVREAQELKKSMERGLIDDDDANLVDDEEFEIIDLPED